MMIMLHSGKPLCYLIKEQLINDFQPSGEEFVMPPHGNILMKCRRGALCNVVDCPTQLTLICILWYLYFMTNIKVTNMKKYSREICWGQGGWGDLGQLPEDWVARNWRNSPAEAHQVSLGK